MSTVVIMSSQPTVVAQPVVVHVCEGGWLWGDVVGVSDDVRPPLQVVEQSNHPLSSNATIHISTVFANCNP